MRIATLLIAAAGVVVLGACASMFGAPPKTINAFIEPTQQTSCPSTCSVQIAIKENADGTCTIDDVLAIGTAGANGTRTISWTIADASPYKFADEPFKFGLLVKTDPQGKFKNAKVLGGAKKLLQVEFDHKKMEGEPKLIYEYGLTVQRSNNTFCLTKDPWVIS